MNATILELMCLAKSVEVELYSSAYDAIVYEFTVSLRDTYDFMHILKKAGLTEEAADFERSATHYYFTVAADETGRPFNQTI